MGLSCQIAEELGFQWVSYGHHTIRPLEEPVKPPHFGVPLYQDPLIGAARALALTKTLEVSTGVLIMPMQHPVRSEEHTSELQSLMRISYAVFCLKNKNNTETKSHNK